MVWKLAEGGQNGSFCQRCSREIVCRLELLIAREGFHRVDSSSCTNNLGKSPQFVFKIRPKDKNSIPEDLNWWCHEILKEIHPKCNKLKLLGSCLEEWWEKWYKGESVWRNSVIQITNKQSKHWKWRDCVWRRRGNTRLACCSCELSSGTRWTYGRSHGLWHSWFVCLSVACKIQIFIV